MIQGTVFAGSAFQHDTKNTNFIWLLNDILRLENWPTMYRGSSDIGWDYLPRNLSTLKLFKGI